MAYEQFAFIYDKLMEEVPYDQWVTFVEKIKEQYFPSQRSFSILDVACGTGELSVQFAKKGWDVTGVDLSEDMLAIANEKASEAQIPIPFFQQNMAELQGFEQQDCIVIFLDSINYLQSEQEVIQTFSSVYDQLKEGGIFLFDVHSAYKINEVFASSTFTLVEDEVSYIWNSFKGEYDNSVEHELTFFVLDEETDQYERMDELHKQRTYPMEHYQAWLQEAGFSVLSIFGDEPFLPISDTSERLYFVCKK